MGGGTGPERIYPKANATAQWWETAFARGTFSSIEKILLHTTETTGWPGYASGSMAPTLTYHPRLRAWRQHCYLNRSARALVDPAGTPVRENRDNVIQIEIIAYADEKKGASVGGLLVSDLADEQLGDLADFIEWLRAEWGGPPLVAAKFLPYPQSYGDSDVRMTSAEYDAFRGVLGHQHASGNAHGDPGALNVTRILQLAGAPTTPSQEDDMQLTDPVKLNTNIEGVAYSSPSSTVGGLLSGTFGYVLQTRNQVSAYAAQQAARDAAILEAIKGTDTASILAAIEATAAAQLDKIAAVVREAVPDDIADDVVAKIGAALTPPPA